MKIQPYLFFEGRAEEAIEFYRTHLGAEVVMLVRFKDSPEPPGMPLPPGSEDKVMHATLQIGESVVLMSDGGCSGKQSVGGFSLSIDVADAAEAKRIFGGLSEGGQVQMPLGETFFASTFGMVQDKFGIGWMVIAGQKK
jgi:PhnB protein